jgi:hypothetical protein
VKALLGDLHAARVRGYAMIDEVFAPDLLAAAAELGPISSASSLFGRPPLGKG